MKETELLLVDGREQVAQALKGMEMEFAFSVSGTYARENGGGAQVIWSEFSNVSTDVPVVDKLVYQVTVRAENLDRLRALCQGVNRAMLKLGLRRTYAGDDGFDSEGAGAYTKTYRFGRKIDKRTMRLID